MTRTPMARTMARLSSIGLLIAAVALGPVAASSPTTAWMPSFNESPGCGAPSGIRGPFASRPGILSDDEPIYGPWGDFFGRTIGSVRDQLVTVRMPGPGARKSVAVHQRVLPALQQALANLAREASRGNTYPITRYTWSFYPATIPPGRNLSFHAVGAAIDVNSDTNPYQEDNVLVTDMIDESADNPSWFVDAWKDAGWCWGGDWLMKKDAMHFSWMGPLYTPGYVMAPPQPPAVPPASFTDEIQLPVGFDPPGPATRHAIGDLSGDSAVDVVRVEPVGPVGHRRLVIATSTSWFRSTSVAGYTAYPPTDPTAPLALVDMNRDSRPDLVYILDDEGTVTLEVFTSAGIVMPRRHITTHAPAAAGSTFRFADLDRDGYQDLFVIRPGSPAALEIWPGPTYRERALSTDLAVDFNTHYFALGDRTVDGIPDLFALDVGGNLTVHTGASGYTEMDTNHIRTRPEGESIFVADLDGDGYGDLLLVAPDGSTRMRRGGASTHHPGIWFADPAFEPARAQARY